MKTVKEVSKLTGISIRTLRYYDEIGLLRPADVSPAGYRLYDEKSLERLWAILFFRELELPLADIKAMMDQPELDRTQILQMQKSLLERKRNRLNRLIELIEDVMEGVNTMSFEVFQDEDVKKIVEHSLELQSAQDTEAIKEKFGSLDAYREHVSQNLKEEERSFELIRIYGSKDKAVKAALSSTGDMETMKMIQDQIDQIYREFARAMEKESADQDAAEKLVHELADPDVSAKLVRELADNYRKLLHVDNARYVLLQLAEGYAAGEILSQVTDQQYGEGVCQFIGQAIRRYYGEE